MLADNKLGVTKTISIFKHPGKLELKKDTERLFWKYNKVIKMRYMYIYICKFRIIWKKNYIRNKNQLSRLLIIIPVVIQ